MGGTTADVNLVLTDDLFIGDVGAGSLTVEDGGNVSNVTGAIGIFAGSSGTAAVTGTGSTWTNSDILIVGEVGIGTLIIQNGGTVSNLTGHVGRLAGSTGVATVSGAGSTWTNSADLVVGGFATLAGGTGTLNVETGGVVNVTEDLVLWEDDTVNLVGGTINLGNLVSNGGTFNFEFGTLNFTTDQTIAAGGLIETALGGELNIHVGQELGIEGTATLLTQLTVDGGTLSVGQLVNPQLVDLRRGTLNITNQPVAIEAGGPFGETLDLPADVSINITQGVTNHGLVTGDGELGGMLHNDTDGELRAEPGRSLSLTGAGNTNDGQISLFGGLLEFTEDLTNNAGGSVSGNGTLIANAGLVNHGMLSFSGTANVNGDVENSASGLIISSGGGPTTFFDDVVNDGEIRTDAGGFTVFFGAVSGTGMFTGTGTINPEDVVSPGNSAGTFIFDGDVVLGSGATAVIELAAGNEYDTLEVAGAASLAGTLNVALINDFDPALGESFEIITADGGVSGEFAGTGFPDLGPLLAMDVIYGSNSVILAVVPAVSGDYNANGVVDAADYTVWRDLLGQVGIGLAADGSGPGGMPDGIIDQLDYQFWKDRFGSTVVSGSAGASPSQAAVPEPAMFVTAMLALLTIVGTRMRRGQMSGVAG